LLHLVGSAILAFAGPLRRAVRLELGIRREASTVSRPSGLLSFHARRATSKARAVSRAGVPGQGDAQASGARDPPLLEKQRERMGRGLSIPHSIAEVSQNRPDTCKAASFGDKLNRINTDSIADPRHV
jgi:hypothetical protein